MSSNGFGAPQVPQVLIAEGAMVQMVQVNPTTVAVGFVFLVQGKQIVFCCSPEAPWELFAADVIRAADQARPNLTPVVEDATVENTPAPVHCWSCAKQIHGPLIDTGGCLVCGPDPSWPTMDVAP